MITAETRAHELRIGKWILIDEHEVSSIGSLAVKPKTTIVRLTNGLKLILNTQQSYLTEVLMM